MKISIRLMLILAALFGAALPVARAEPSTVCTITVNSADEREIFKRNLPAGDFRFVELVERGRPDWLASACQQGVRCDMLVISGHFDAGTEFYSDRLDAREYLQVDEMERVSCSESCPGLFSQLKEVYLFGCNTLNNDAIESTAEDVAGHLVRSGTARSDAERLAQELKARHRESNRDGMRRIFPNVPVIYGFSKLAPLGPTAGAMLGRYFQSGEPVDIGTGRVSARLLGQFGVTSMTATPGLVDSDLDAAYRRDVCHFHDDRIAAAEKVAFVHQLLRRDAGEVRMFFDRVERYLAALSERDRQSPAVAQALQEIALDDAARKRFLEFARHVERPAVRVRMLEVARALHWLTPAEQQAEIVRMIGERMATAAIDPADVDLVCTLNGDRALDAALPRLVPGVAYTPVARAAMLACLGSEPARGYVLGALSSGREDDVQVAQAYLRHRPIADEAEMRSVVRAIANMTGPQAQVRALATLERHYLADREAIDALTGLFPRARTVDVQRAIASVLIRADYRAIAKPDIVRMLQRYRLKSPDGADLIDALIRRLQAAV
jgi:hypothetical protein